MAKDFIGEQGVIITAGRTFDFTDETGAGADDGTPITKEKVMQIMAVFQHLMVAAGYTHNGLVENAVSQTPGDTQYYDALTARANVLIQAATSINKDINTIAKRDAAGVLRSNIDMINTDSYISSNTEPSLAIVPNMEFINRAIPVGTIIAFGSATLPAGWFECNGAAISRTTYPLLFAAIGTTWGAGDGSTTFTLPDFRNRVIAGAGTGLSGSINAFTLPEATSADLNMEVGEYRGAGSTPYRYAAGVKFAIRAL